jgi:hypothetical protein
LFLLFQQFLDCDYLLFLQILFRQQLLLFQQFLQCLCYQQLRLFLHFLLFQRFLN